MLPNMTTDSRLEGYVDSNWVHCTHSRKLNKGMLLVIPAEPGSSCSWKPLVAESFKMEVEGVKSFREDEESICPRWLLREFWTVWGVYSDNGDISVEKPSIDLHDSHNVMEWAKSFEQNGISKTLHHQYSKKRIVPHKTRNLQWLTSFKIWGFIEKYLESI